MATRHRAFPVILGAAIGIKARRDQKFESGFLQRGVCLSSVPQTPSVKPKKPQPSSEMQRDVGIGSRRVNLAVSIR
jgi:hypothetical protein